MIQWKWDRLATTKPSAGSPNRDRASSRSRAGGSATGLSMTRQSAPAKARATMAELAMTPSTRRRAAVINRRSRPVWGKSWRVATVGIPPTPRNGASMWARLPLVWTTSAPKRVASARILRTAVQLLGPAATADATNPRTPWKRAVGRKASWIGTTTTPTPCPRR